MWKTIAKKSYSYSHDDTMTDTEVTAYLEVDTSTGALEVHKVTTASSPYISGGKSKREETTKAGTLSKPSLGDIVKATSNSGSYHKFPHKWETWDGKESSAADAISSWNAENGDSKDTDVRRRVIEKINKMSGPELDNVRRILRIVACKTIKGNIVKVANSMRKRISNEIISMEFPTKDALEDYLRKHPLAKRENHHVVENKQTIAPKTDKPNTGDKPHESIYNTSVPENKRLTDYTKALLTSAKKNDILSFGDDGKPEGNFESEEAFENLADLSGGDAAEFMNGLTEISDEYNNPVDLASVGIAALQSPKIKSMFGTDGCKQVANHFFEEALSILQEGPAWERNPDDPQPPTFSLPAKK